MADWWSNDKAAGDEESWWEADKAEADTAKRELPSGVKPSEAGSGRGVAEGDPRRLDVARRGGRRSEVRPYVAGDAGAGVLDMPEQQVVGRGSAPSAGQLLETPRPGGEAAATEADLAQLSKSPDRLAAERAAMRAPQVAKSGKPTMSDQAADAVRTATGSDTAGAVTARAVDAALLAPEAVATTGKIVADIANLATLGGAQAASEWMGSVVKGVQGEKSARFRQQQAELGKLLKDDRAGVLDVAEFLASNPAFAAEVGIPSLPSILVAAGSGRAAGALNAALTARRGGTAADIAAAYRTGAGAGSTAGNVAMNAGDTFGETEGGVIEKLLAAGAAGAGTALAGKLPGAERVLAGAGVAGRSRVASSLVTGAAGGAQEGLESLSQSLGKGTVEGNFDINQAGKQAVVEGVAGIGPGLVAGAMHAPAPTRVEFDAEAMARQRGFLSNTPELTNFTPADSAVARAGITPVVVPTQQSQPVDPVVEDRSVTPAPAQPGGMPDFTAAMAAVDERLQGPAPAARAEATQPATQGTPAAAQDGPTQASSAPAEASAPTAEPEAPAAAQPTTTWTGRRGDGYVNQADATQALAGRQKREPGLDWRVEQRQDGKWVLNGYNQSTTTTEATDGRTDDRAAGDAVAAGQASAGQSVQGGPGLGAELQRGLGGSGGSAGATSFGSAAPTVDESTLRSDLSFIQNARLKRGEVTKLEPVQDAAVQPEVRAVAAAFGRPVTIIRDVNGRASFGAVVTNKDRIYINQDAPDAALSLTVHELVHTLPQGIREALVERVMRHVTPEGKQRFLWKYEGYAKLDEAKQNEELVAMFAQDDSKRPEFWADLHSKLGDGDFKALAKHIINKLGQLLSKIRRGDDTKFVTDVEAVRDAVTTALAKAQRGETYWHDDLEVSGDGGVDVQEITMDEAGFSERGRKERVGEFDARVFKDGSIEVRGDAADIRGRLPEDVKGRVTDTGVRFKNSDAARVRATLEGRGVAYSRAGEVIDRLPRATDGTYLGAPPDYNTPAKIPTLRKILRQLADEGAPGRMWYEKSSAAVLHMTGGNVQEARKFVALLAIYSPQAKVDANSTFALRAWAQYKAGQPVSVKTAVMDRKATEALADVDRFWSGEKTGNFFHNLLREIDQTTAGKQGATIDMWMMRAGQYANDAPTKTQYAFMENETNRLAKELGWEPQQVQAAIWVAMKARMENAGVKKRTEAKSEKRGWIKFTKNAKGAKVRVIIDEQKHRDNWLAMAMGHDVTKSDTAQAKFDFADGVRRHIGQVSFEARPGRTTGVLPGIHSAPYAQQVEFQQAVQKAFYDDETGEDMLARQLGLLVDQVDIVPGVWQGEVSPSSQISVPMAPTKNNDPANQVDPAQKIGLNVYAAVAGLVAKQEGVGWHRPFYASTKRDANGVDIDIGRPLNPAEAADVERLIAKWMEDNGKTSAESPWNNAFAIVSSPNGVRLINFGVVTNQQLHTDVLAAIEPALPDATARVFASDGDMPTNNWETNRNGQDYVQRIGAEGRSDVLDWARTVLAPRVQAVFDEFSQRYGWGDPGSIDFSEQAGDGGRREAGGSLAPLDGAPRVAGATGPDPRLVEVAERYARDAGITLKRQGRYVDVDITMAKRLAAAYEAMPHAPQDPRVREAYENLIRQTTAQYEALVDAGYKFWFMDPAADPYDGNPWNAMRDLRANQSMAVFPTEAGFGSGATDLNVDDNPLLADTGIEWPYGSPDGEPKRVLANDLFRAVHDAFGHGLEGAGFRARGEENAWQAHARLFTGSALAALTSETRGQNSWLNFGPYGERNRKAKVEDTVFADQKTGLMPEWTWTDGVEQDAQFSESSGQDAYRPPIVPEVPLAPNGKRSKLTRSQWLQVRSPAFKRWFGDWEKHANAANPEGSLWSDPNVSKAVDPETREPMVVYHGTDVAGFVRFRQTGGRQRGDLGIFLTDNQSMANSYVRRGRARQVTRNLVDDVQDGILDHESGVYGLFVNIRNPQEEDFYGANWDGSMAGTGLYEVLDEDGDMVTTSDGRVYMSRDEAKELAAEEPGRTFDSARDLFLSTDDVVRAARSDGQDGAIIRNVVDDGGGNSSYWGDPSTVIAVFDPRQVKSADFNDGTFDNTDDIRFSDQPRFYSELARAIERGPGQAPAEQWRMFLRGLTSKGVKAEEIEWSGIEDWLKLQAGKVKKEAVLEYLRQGGVRVEEVVLGTKSSIIEGRDAALGSTEMLGYDTKAAALTALKQDYRRMGDADRVLDQYDLTDTEREQLKAWLEAGDMSGDRTKYGQYTLPGGTNYREVLLTLPAAETTEQARVRLKQKYPEWREGQSYKEVMTPADQRDFERSLEASAANYRSAHWDQPNIIAHIRLNDRVDSDGRRVLFVEELQSDWAQAGRKKGFVGGYKTDDVTPISAVEAGFMTRKDDELFWFFKTPDNVFQIPKSKYADRDEAKAYIVREKKTNPGGIQPAPFVTKTDSWLNLALKRVITMAVDGGYDRVAFVTGEQSAERYDLSKRIKEINYEPMDGDLYEINAKDLNGREVISEDEVTIERIEDLVGKEIAKKIAAGEGEHTGGAYREWRTLIGLDLKVGGEGMKSFYDVIVPNAVKGLLKKLGGGKVIGLTFSRAANPTQDEADDKLLEDLGADIPSASAPVQPGFDITLAMREAADGGLPLFSDYGKEKDAWGRKFLPGQRKAKKMRGSDLKVGSVKSDAAVAMLTSTVDAEYPIINAARKAGDDVGNAWKMAVEALPGRTADAVEQARRELVEPFTEAIGKAAKKLDIDPGQLVDAYGVYRTALHAPERNKTLRANGSKKANPAGMSEAESSQWLTFFRSEPELLAALQSFDPMLKAIQQKTDDIKMAAGLLTQDDIDARSGWQHYVSLRGDPGADEIGGSRGQGGWNNDVDPRAKGRDSLSANPVVNTVKMLENAIRLAEMARVKKATYEFALAHPDIIGAKVEKLFRRPLFDENGNFAKAVPNREKFAEDAVVYRNGDTEYHIEIGDGKVVEAIKRLEKDNMGFVLRGFGKLTSVLGRMWTQFSPHFPLVNFIRDLQQQLAYIAGSDMKIGGKKVSSAKAAFLIATRYPRTFGAAVSEVMGRKPSGKYTKYARELIAAGGTSGLTKMLSDEESLKDFVKEVAQKAGKAKASLAWDKFIDAVAGINDVFELTTRVAGYSVMRDMGMPADEAANFTKNLMNFSKAGAETRKLGNLYMFLKPSVQDVYLTSKLLRTRKGAIVLASMYTGAVALYSMLRALSGDDEEDPRLKKMDKRTASERRGYYILPIGNKEPVRIPVGFGLPRMAWGLAVASVDLARNPDYDAADFVDNAFKSMTSTLSPLQLSDINMFKSPWTFLGTTFAPTIGVPVIELIANKTKGGSMIHKENARASLPDYTRGFSSTPKEWKDASQWMYDFTKGEVDIAPEILPFLLRSYGGGPASLMLNALNSREKLRQGESLSGRDAPVVQAFVGPRDRYPERKFRDLSEDIDKAQKRIKDSEQRDGKLATEILSDKETALKASLKKSVDKIERDEAKALEQTRRLQMTDYEAGAREVRRIEREARAAKQALLTGYNSERTKR